MSLPFSLTICGLDELPSHSERGVSHVLSILDPDWPVPDAFGSYGEHARLELRFHDVIEPQPGVVLPRLSHVQEILAFGRDLLAEPAAGAGLLVHCHAGVSRSTAAMLLLIAQADAALAPDDLADTLLGIRRQAWPNLRIVELGAAELGRPALVTAARTIYRRQIERRPELALSMEAIDRAREVRLAAADA